MIHKYRIVGKITTGSIHPTTKWIIEKKHILFGWREVLKIEGPNSYSIHHKTYEDAEKYLISEYTTSYGNVTINGNVYYYKPHLYLGY
jgi:hypothetical protein